MSMLASLPGELYSAILQHVPEEDLQFAVLSLTRVLPNAPVSLHHLFKHIRLRIPGQAVLLQRRLRQKVDGKRNSACQWVETLSIQDWVVDADVVLNIINLLPNLQSLNIWIGANNFSPEHLEELFEKPFGNLRDLSLRFRPYVQKANYYQFLKGAYFDSTLLALSRWPPSQIPALSIVQDPIDSTMGFATRQAFAQPLVFFKLDGSMAALLQSPAMVESLTAFRLRIPGRPVARSLCLPTAQLTSAGRIPQVPSIEILDLSTCGVLEGEVDMILSQFMALKHIILDDCSILRGEHGAGEWTAMGKRCALVGVRRGKEREKAMKAALESMAQAEQNGAQIPHARRPRRGRRGLATATISLRDPRPPRNQATPVLVYADDQPNANPGISTSSSTPRVNLSFPKTRVLPPLPSLATLCTTVSAVIRPEAYPAIRAEFEAGWAEGIAVLAVTRARLRESAKNGVNIVRFSESSQSSSGSDSEASLKVSQYHPVFQGLEKVDKNDYEAFDVPDATDAPAPVLCFAGKGGDVDHAPGCGHSIAQDIWRD